MTEANKEPKQKATLRDYGTLMRLQAIGAVFIVLVIGALSNSQGQELGVIEYLKLFAIAAFTYISCIVMNEYYDIEVDRASNALSKKPLVTGIISKKTALIICWARIDTFF